MKKIISRSETLCLAKYLKSRRKKIVFTNGTFDILHLGHIHYLQKAKQMGDVLVIGVNTDRSVKSYKNPDRPFNPQRDRIRILTALSCVDHAILFDEPTPLKLILDLKPHTIVKGADWKKHEIVGRREIALWGGKIKRISLVRGRSTTQLIKKIQKAHRQKS